MSGAQKRELELNKLNKRVFAEDITKLLGLFTLLGSGVYGAEATLRSVFDTPTEGYTPVKPVSTKRKKKANDFTPVESKPPAEPNALARFLYTVFRPIESNTLDLLPYTPLGLAALVGSYKLTKSLHQANQKRKRDKIKEELKEKYDEKSKNILKLLQQQREPNIINIDNYKAAMYLDVMSRLATADIGNKGLVKKSSWLDLIPSWLKKVYMLYAISTGLAFGTSGFLKSYDAFKTKGELPEELEKKLKQTRKRTTVNIEDLVPDYAL